LACDLGSTNREALLPLAATMFSVDDPADGKSAAGGVPVWASIDSCSACEAGVFFGTVATDVTE